jgi:quercetin dioxygenase-like cupin family protein
MDPKKLTEIFEQEAVILPNYETEANGKPWYPHPAMEGVFLKDLVTGKETGGAFSYHLVRVWKDHEVLDHNHDTQWEWNLVISGKGTFVFGNKEVPVAPGRTFVTPPKIHHAVIAGSGDISLLALFVPALA